MGTGIPPSVAKTVTDLLHAAQLTRLDEHGGSWRVAYLVSDADDSQILSAVSRLRRAYPRATVTTLDLALAHYA